MQKKKIEELDRISVEQYKASRKTPITVILDNVRSLSNVGSIFRTADAFLIEAIYLCGITAKPPHREIAKTALGAQDSVDWKYFKETKGAVQSLLKNDYEIYAVEQMHEHFSLQDFIPQKEVRYGLIFGNEVQGVSENCLPLVQGAIEIPQLGTKHSFNVSVSAGIVLWDIWSKIQRL